MKWRVERSIDPLAKRPWLVMDPNGNVVSEWTKHSYAVLVARMWASRGMETTA